MQWLPRTLTIESALNSLNAAPAGPDGHLQGGTEDKNGFSAALVAINGNGESARAAPASNGNFLPLAGSSLPPLTESQNTLQSWFPGDTAVALPEKTTLVSPLTHDPAVISANPRIDLAADIQAALSRNGESSPVPAGQPGSVYAKSLTVTAAVGGGSSIALIPDPSGAAALSRPTTNLSATSPGNNTAEFSDQLLQPAVAANGNLRSPAGRFTDTAQALAARQSPPSVTTGATKPGIPYTHGGPNAPVARFVANPLALEQAQVDGRVGQAAGTHSVASAVPVRERPGVPVPRVNSDSSTAMPEQSALRRLGRLMGDSTLAARLPVSPSNTAVPDNSATSTQINLQSGGPRIVGDPGQLPQQLPLERDTVSQRDGLTGSATNLQVDVAKYGPGERLSLSPKPDISQPLAPVPSDIARSAQVAEFQRSHSRQWTLDAPGRAIRHEFADPKPLRPGAVSTAPVITHDIQQASRNAAADTSPVPQRAATAAHVPIMSLESQPSLRAAAGQLMPSVQPGATQTEGMAATNSSGNVSATAPAAAPAAPAAPLMPTSTMQAPTALPSINVPVTDQRWGETLNERVLVMAGQKIQRADIRLNPAELGPVRIEIRVDDNGTQVNFVASHSVTREAIEQAMPRLRELLSSEGLNLNGATVNENGVKQGKGESTDSRQADAANQEATGPSDEGHAAPARSRHREPEGLVDTFV